MSQFHLMVATVFMLVSTVVIIAVFQIMFRRERAYQVAQVDVPELYENRQTGKLILVTSYNGEIAVVSDEHNTWGMKRSILSREYNFIGRV